MLLSAGRKDGDSSAECDDPDAGMGGEALWDGMVFGVTIGDI